MNAGADALLIACTEFSIIGRPVGTDCLVTDALDVLVEATIAEVTLTNDLQYGLQYFFHAHENQFIFGSTTTAITALGTRLSVAQKVPSRPAISIRVCPSLAPCAR